MSRRPFTCALVVSIVLVAACSSDDDTDEASGDTAPASTVGATTTASTDAPSTTAGAATTLGTAAPPTSDAPGAATGVERAYYILPPGNYGGLPTNDDSLDQLPLYSGLTPLRDDITDTDLDEFFLPQDFAPIGETTVIDTGRAGLELLYDEFGVPHITGDTRADVAFGAGWATARDRNLLFDLGRGPARAAVADIPGVDAFGLVVSGQSFVPSEATEQLVTDQVDLIIETYGDEGEEIIADAQAYADGINAYWAANDINEEPATVNDVIATTAFIGSIFGAGGGGETRQSALLAGLQAEHGDDLGYQLWNDLLPPGDPETPTTIDEVFEYPTFTGGEVVGSVVIDDGSLVALSPIAGTDDDSSEDDATNDDTTDDADVSDDEGADSDGEAVASGDEITLAAAGDGRGDAGAAVFVDATDQPPFRTASNWLMVAPEESTNGTTLAVQGPQLGYYYPEIVQQMHLKGPDFEAQGAAVPGLAMYMLIGRTEGYSWSLTSAGHDVRDTFVERLCEPDGSAPTVDSRHYEFDGECVAFENFEAGTLGGEPVAYPVSVHGPMIGTATVDGEPVALTRQRSTFGRDGLNLKALKDMTEGDAATADAFFETANQFGFTFNWGYANNDGIAYFSSGYLPERSPGLDRRLPTWGTGEYEWQGFLDLDDHPHASGHDTGRLLNWNNQAAPGFIHGDGSQYGAAHRVEVFDQWPEQSELTDVVGVMNRAASEDVRSTVWPVIDRVLAEGEPPSELAAQVADIVSAWIADDAPRIDADDDGVFDSPGPGLMDILTPRFATAITAEYDIDVAASGAEGPSLVDKDLRTVLGDEVDGAYTTSFCGDGDIDECAAVLWATIEESLPDLVERFGDDPTTWLATGDRSSFTPGLLPNDFPSTNRPTYQQVIEFTAP